MELQKEIKATKKVIEQFAKDEGYTKSDLIEINEALEECDLTKLGQGDLFLMFDALGCHGERTEVMEHFYGATAAAWQASAIPGVDDIKRVAVLTDITKELNRNIEAILSR